MSPLKTVGAAGAAQSAPLMPLTMLNFAGIDGSGCNCAPPDANLAVGPNDVIQAVNVSFEIWNKNGVVVQTAEPISTVFSGFGGSSGCGTQSTAGDPIVKYDRLSGRWLISQASDLYSSSVVYECVAISTTGDPTGSYNRYSFAYSAAAIDWPKISVWPDAYYATLNLYGTTTYDGAAVCAYDRAAMLAGSNATQQCFVEPSPNFGLMPGDFEGSLAPPAGEGDTLVSLLDGGNTSGSALGLWTFHVDWANPANTTLSGPTSLAVATYAEACGAATPYRDCIPQKGTTQALDSVGDRPMYRLAYRNFGDHESLVFDHSVDVGNSSVGIRWYELRLSGGAASVYQQGTYAPNDGRYRWMGSIAMDQVGDMVMGYSLSSSTMFPAIGWTGRVASDTADTMGQAEAVIDNGMASQTWTDRWGDYTSIVVDPSDDCTFWYTNQYLMTTNIGGWQTSIATVKFAQCHQPVASTSLASSSNPSVFGQSITLTATVTNSSGSCTPAGSVAFMDGGNNIGNAQLSGSPAQATLVTSGLATGTHSLTAVYTPNDNTCQGSTSSAIAQVVNQAGTTTRLSASPNPAGVGHAVNYLAQVNVSPPGAGTPTGTVAFSDGGTLISGCEAVTLSASGSASCTVTYSAGGTHNVTATYSGDTNFLSSTSAVVIESVRTAISGLTVTVNPALPAVPATYTINFTTSSSGALAPGATINLIGPAGTAFPGAVADYSVQDANGGTDAVGRLTLRTGRGSSTANQVAMKLSASGIGNLDAVTVTISMVNNPGAGTYRMKGWTSADPLRVNSSSYTIAASTTAAMRPGFAFS